MSDSSTSSALSSNYLWNQQCPSSHGLERVLNLICHIWREIPSATQQMSQILQILTATLYFDEWNKHNHITRSGLWDSGTVTRYSECPWRERISIKTMNLLFSLSGAPHNMFSIFLGDQAPNNVAWPGENIPKQGNQTQHGNTTVCWGSHSVAGKRTTIFIFSNCQEKKHPIL